MNDNTVKKAQVAYTGDAWRYCENLSDPEAIKQLVQATLTARATLDFALTKVGKDEFGTVPDWLAVKRALDAALKAVGHGAPPKVPEPPAPPPFVVPQRFVVQVVPTCMSDGEQCPVTEMRNANMWSIYTGGPGNFAWVADFALTQKDVALHFAADLAVRLGYGMDRSAVDVVEANDERDLSHEEGWGLFEVDGRYQLQRFEDVFDSDVDALMWVAQQAIDGSARHRAALRKIGSLA